MKKATKSFLIFFLISGFLIAQQEKGIVGENNWLNNWTEFQPAQRNYYEPSQILTGNITKDTKLNKRDTYLLVGNVFVTNGATLSIEPGTVIIGDFKTKASLTIAKGAKIIAEGLETDPIVFTSNQSVKRAGDWGGIILLGDAPTNKFGNGSVASFFENLDPGNYIFTNYGGENPKSNSGILKYVRIEYSGKRIGTAGNFSGVMLAGVGNETMIQNVMISYCEGDAFRVLGGNVTLEKLVSFKNNGNDYHFNFGTQAQLTNSLVVRSPYVSSRDGSRAIRAMSYDKKEEVDFSKSGTSLVANNLTLLNDSEDLKNDIKMGLVRAAVYVGHNVECNMEKTVISGFNPAVLFQEGMVINQQSLDKLKFSEMYFNNCNGNLFVENNSNNEDLENWYGNSAFFNVYSKGANEETFIDIKNLRRPDYRLRINKIIASSIQGTDLLIEE